MKSISTHAAEFGKYRQRAIRRAKASAGASLYRVEGQAVTAEAVAERLGVARKTALRRIYRERKKGNVTWEGLSE